MNDLQAIREWLEKARDSADNSRSARYTMNGPGLTTWAGFEAQYELASAALSFMDDLAAKAATS